MKRHDRWYGLLRNTYSTPKYFYTFTLQLLFKLNSHLKHNNILTKHHFNVVLICYVPKRCKELENLT